MQGVAGLRVRVRVRMEGGWKKVQCKQGWLVLGLT